MSFRDVQRPLSMTDRANVGLAVATTCLPCRFPLAPWYAPSNALSWWGVWGVWGHGTSLHHLQAPHRPHTLH